LGRSRSRDHVPDSLQTRRRSDETGCGPRKVAGRSVGDPKEPLSTLRPATSRHNEKSWSDRELRPHQAKLRRRRDLARQRWPFGQHKMAVCLVAWTAVPESLRRFRWWSRPMISCRDEVSALTTTVAAQSVPRDANALWPGSDEDLRWRPSAFLACHFARSITNKLSKVDPQAARARSRLSASTAAPSKLASAAPSSAAPAARCPTGLRLRPTPS